MKDSKPWRTIGTPAWQTVYNLRRKNVLFWLIGAGDNPTVAAARNLILPRTAARLLQSFCGGTRRGVLAYLLGLWWRELRADLMFRARLWHLRNIRRMTESEIERHIGAIDGDEEPLP